LAEVFYIAPNTNRIERSALSPLNTKKIKRRALSPLNTKRIERSHLLILNRSPFFILKCEENREESSLCF
jgi:hypothetical protein